MGGLPMHKVKRMLMAFVLIAIAVAVSAQTSSRRDLNPKVPYSDLSDLVTGNSIFAIDAYKDLSKNASQNMIFSPYSLSNALAMTWAGARGETGTQITKSLHFFLPQARLHSAFNRLDLTLMARVAGDQATDVPMIISANSLWPQAGYDLRREFVDTLAVKYGIELSPVDYVSEPDNARQAINKWVEERTLGRIPSLIDQLNTGTRLLVINAVTFKGRWENPFSAELTKTEEFITTGGIPVMASFMVRKGEYPYVIEDDLLAVELPYAGGDWSMIVIMPKGGFGKVGDFDIYIDAPTLIEYENRLTIEEINRIRNQLDISRKHGVTIELHFPSFEIKSDHDLVPVLLRMGMPLAFDRWEADFSGIATPPLLEDELFITRILQKALMKVTVEGTEAVAATAVIGGVRGGLPKKNPDAFMIDHPFIVCLQHRPTGAILFMGKVLDPTLK
jgi:serpin B